MALTTYIDGITQGLREEMQRDPNVFAQDENAVVAAHLFRQRAGDRVYICGKCHGLLVSFYLLAPDGVLHVHALRFNSRSRMLNENTWSSASSGSG